MLGKSEKNEPNPSPAPFVAAGISLTESSTCVIKSPNPIMSTNTPPIYTFTFWLLDRAYVLTVPMNHIACKI